jgi:arylamine N-acetyltransferase
MVNLVKIDDMRYLVDVGFGRGNAVVPLPLVSGHEIAGWGEQRLRLEHRAIAQHSDRSQRLWVYSYKESEKTPWKSCYAFPELEFFPADFEIMNLSTMTLRASWFTQQVICCRFRLDESQEKVVGVTIVFGNRLRTIVVGKEGVDVELNGEEERVAALEREFGIVLNAAERRGINGLSSELKAL